MSKQHKDATNVVLFPRDQVEEVLPPESWRLKLELDHGRSKATYFQKVDAKTPLVRIVDVLTDFADRRGLPAGNAVEDFLNILDASLLNEVYELHEHNFANAVGAEYMYGFDTKLEAEDISTRLHGVADANRSSYPWANSPLEALKKHILAHGPQASDRSLFAVSHVHAHNLWGWGCDAGKNSEAAKDCEPNKPIKKARYDWGGDPTLYAKLLDDFNKTSGKTIKDRHKKVAEKWETSPANVKKQLGEGKKLPPKTPNKVNSPFPS